MTGAAVEMVDLSRQFGSFVAVDKVNLVVHRGEIFGFLGANGAGKTTTIRMLCGLLRPSSGRGTVGGFDIDREPERIKRIIGYMSQRFSLYDDLTVRENLHFFGGVYGLNNHGLRERIAVVADRLGLRDLLGSMVRALPLGFKQRLSLASAILHQPRILFLDEPTGGVDPAARRNFWDIIYELAAGGTTVFVTTHYMDEAEYCHRLSIMHHGRLIAAASPWEMKSTYGKDTMEEVFIHLIEEDDNGRQGGGSTTGGAS
ncbi:ABC transporter ATP-binding protein [bacterium]|nr:ABC transporter ATP-binding protein [candidate division CSSED10-310 bacterium]